jgi:monooxygenase
MRYHFDVLIVGAGLSGIGMACHLQEKCPDKTYAILEARASMGGTWDLFRYPGVRSDSDMFTLAYKFKPWDGAKDIADGSSILQYIKGTAEEYQIEQHVRYDHVVQKAEWSTEHAAWTVEARLNTTGERVLFTSNMLLVCAGYYSYESGYTPELTERERFRGQIIHPQHWPADLDYAGKRVIVIGSGATAVTLVPAIAAKAEQVVMLQRSPSYVLSRPEVAPLARVLRKTLPSTVSATILRWWNCNLSGYFYRRSRSKPEQVRKWLLRRVRRQLGADYDVEQHFNPKYSPWDQRVCIAPDGDFFKAIKSKKAAIVTDHLDRFTEEGILLKSGEELKADIVVTATGLNMQVLGGIEVVVDGCRVDFSQTYTYKGMMNSDVPNLVTTFGYINASWTLRADLIAEFVCRLINHLDERRMRQCTPRLREADLQMASRPFIEDFSSNYIRRALHLLPKQGDREPWLNIQDYRRELKMIRHGALEDGVLVFDNPVTSRTGEGPARTTGEPVHPATVRGGLGKGLGG